MSTPYVSCIMPTANRPNFVELAVNHFVKQNFEDTELIIADDGFQSVKPILADDPRIKYYYTDPLGTIGKKRNFACQMATGKIIMHWDDDDWYAKDWISCQINALNDSQADICGLNEITFFSPIENKFWKYADRNTERPWLSGATMAYRKSFWLDHPFKDLQIGEDYDYIWNTGAKIYAHDYTQGFIATLHNSNTTLKPFEKSIHKKHAIEWMNVPFEGDTENPEQSRFYK